MLALARALAVDHIVDFGTPYGFARDLADDIPKPITHILNGF